MSWISSGKLSQFLRVSIPTLTFVSSSTDLRRAVISSWQKYVHLVLVGFDLPRNTVVRLTDRPDMTKAIYLGRKAIVQQQQQLLSCRC